MQVKYSAFFNILKMSNGYKLDSTDKRILIELQKNSQLTVKELAEKIHLSPSPTFERQKRLEREGYITRYMAVVDAEKAGNGIMVLWIQQFIDAVQNIDEITECFNTSGDYDFMIKVYAREMHAYQQFMQHKLGAMSCLGSLHSVFVMAETKNTHGVAILP